ncbi:MAG: hypothetical protein ACKV2V_23980 [Blastocatellia bacterium]
MTKQEVRRLEMYRRVLEFMEACQDEFAPGSPCRKLLNDLTEAVARLHDRNMTQSFVGNRATARTAGKRNAREEVLDTLKSIRATSVTMARTQPGLDSQFALPAKKVNDEVLLAIANGFAVAAEPLAGEFIAHEMPADFIAALRAQIANLEAVMKQSSAAFTTRRTATKSIGADTAEGLRLVRALDPLIRNKYRGDRGRIEEWEIISRVQLVGLNGTAAGAGEQTQDETGG